MIKIKDETTKEDLGTIKLNFIPRKDEYIQFNDKNFIVIYVMHSDKETSVFVNEIKEKKFFTF